MMMYVCIKLGVDSSVGATVSKTRANINFENSFSSNMEIGNEIFFQLWGRLHHFSPKYYYWNQYPLDTLNQ